jgi:hypothetical protein
MTDGAPEPGQAGGASPQTRRFVARREAVRAAAAADRARAVDEAAERRRDIVRDYDNPLAFGLGLAVILLLLGGGWFIMHRLHCDPLFSDLGLRRRQACE